LSPNRQPGVCFQAFDEREPHESGCRPGVDRWRDACVYNRFVKECQRLFKEKVDMYAHQVRRIATALALVLLVASVPVIAQMHQGTTQMQQGTTQMQGHQHGTQGTQGMQGMQGTQNMAGMMASTQQMMQNIDAMMTSSSNAMHNLSAMQPGTAGSPQHGQMVSAMQGMLDQMKQIQTSMNEWMKNPDLMHNSDAMKAFQQTCANFEQMTKAFDAMAKQMNQVMQSASHGPKK
jgi:hypothetical protein